VVAAHRQGSALSGPYAKRSISACASAISGISGVVEKPIERGPEDGVCIDRRGGRLIELGQRERRYIVARGKSRAGQAASSKGTACLVGSHG